MVIMSRTDDETSNNLPKLLFEMKFGVHPWISVICAISEFPCHRQFELIAIVLHTLH